MLVETEVITDVNEKQFETTGVVEWSQEFKSRAQLWRERDKQHEQEKKALNAELEAERQSRQKLLSAQYELQERIDSLQSKPAPKEHRRSLSDASNNSQQETTVEDDYGYGSVRSVESTRPALEAVNWSAGTHNGPTQPVADAGLVLRMRNRISALQSELSRTTKRAADLEDRIMNRHSTPATNPNIDRYKLEELEIENKKLREHLDRLRAAGDSMLVSKEVIEQMNVMQKELDRRRDECIQLKSVLTNQTVNLKSLASSNYGSDVDIINEDGELATAYEAQKGINRQLQEELLLEKKFYSEHISKSKAEIEKLREENEKYQKLLSADLSAEPKNKTQEFAQNEIIRLAAESLALQERVDKLSESCRRYKNQIRLLVNKLKEVGIDDVNDILDSNDPVVPPNASMTLEMAPVTRKKEREYLGMFEYKIQDEGLIIKKLISDLKPKTAVTLLPGLPAYILFMMLRHMDHVDDEPKMHQLMKAVRTAVKKTLKKRAESVEYNALWLANMLRLLNNLRQYSGDTIYQSANTPRQNQQCLRIFDLSEYRQVLSDIAVWIYQGLIHLLERQLERLIIPAILEHEEISGLSGPSARPPQAGAGPQRLKQELSATHDHLHTFAVDQPLRLMIFKQLFYYICAYSLNQLLLRKDLCCWAKGLQIRYNISHLETWIKEHLAEYGQKSVEEILGVLKPITQAVQLLQARKSMQDVQSTVDMCANLTAMQVCKILNMYTPAEEYEVKVTREFIHEIQKKMQEKTGANPDKDPQNLLMDTKMIFSVQFPFNPSSIRLEAIELPEVLELEGLLTKI
uniref:SFRICE_008266 n=1 Tax=Spodoptera frugiperda TaxID=7108 RepID=A0A2H1V2L3_SPOFR